MVRNLSFFSLPHFTSAFLSPADKTPAGSTYFVPERECFSPIFPLSYRRFMMKSYCVSSLDSFRKDQIQTMVNTCTAHDHTSLSFPFEDASLFLFSEYDRHTVSAIAFVPVDNLLFECSAFTDPEFRGQGLFSALLDRGSRNFQRIPNCSSMWIRKTGTPPLSLMRSDGTGL